jgi:hypothetical protein
LKVKAGRKGKAKVGGEGVGAEGKVEGEVDEGSVGSEEKAQEEPVVEVKEEQPVHVQA